MLFNSLHFVLFFISVTTAYFIIPFRYRVVLLLVSSCYFYMVFLPIYILILVFVIIVDYVAGLYIEKTKELKKRKRILLCSLITNISTLAIFKYYNFLNENISLFLNSIGYTNHIPNLNILLPVGLSFHTFQAMSYTIEVYKERQKAETSFLKYALYVMFYPQLVAGPIERPQNILKQISEKHQFEYQRVTDGLKLMVWGFFKKVVIADRVALCVNTIYDEPMQFSGLPLILGAVFFAIQIYCDFSGYSDIAIGSAQVLGFNLMLNFNRPFFAKSLRELWQRWHISLSTWFRDYLYIPLGGNKGSKWIWYRNILLTFSISGLWHGAKWQYVLWGLLNGLFIIGEIKTEYCRQKIADIIGLYKFPYFNQCLKVFTTFSLFCLTFIVFRANTLWEGFYVVSHLFSNLIASFSVTIFPKIGLFKYDFVIVIMSVLTLFFVEWKHKNLSIPQYLRQKPLYVRWIAYLYIMLCILLLGVFDTPSRFIYFQF